MTKLTNEQLVELAKNPEFRAELAVRQAKTSGDLLARIAGAIRDAVRQDRTEVDAMLAQRVDECFCADEGEVCNTCCEVARVRGSLSARPER
jgi:hypothetical protein